MVVSSEISQPKRETIPVYTITLKVTLFKIKTHLYSSTNIHSDFQIALKIVFYVHSIANTIRATEVKMLRHKKNYCLLWFFDHQFFVGGKKFYLLFIFFVPIPLSYINIKSTYICLCPLRLFETKH